MQVYLGNADIATNLYLRESQSFVDQVPYFTEHSSFVGPRPKRLSQIRNVAYPLHNYTWLLLGCSILFAMASFVMLSKLSKVYESMTVSRKK